MTGEAAEYAAQAIAREVARRWTAADETIVARIARHHIDLYRQTLIGLRPNGAIAHTGGAQDCGAHSCGAHTGALHTGGAQDGKTQEYGAQESAAHTCATPEYGAPEFTTPEFAAPEYGQEYAQDCDEQGSPCAPEGQEKQTLRVPSPASAQTTASHATWSGTSRHRSHSPSLSGSNLGSLPPTWNDEQALREILHHISTSPGANRNSSGLLAESALLADSPPLLMSRSLGDSEVTSSTPAVMHCTPHKLTKREPTDHGKVYDHGKAYDNSSAYDNGHAYDNGNAYEMTYDDHTFSLQELPRAEKSASMSQVNENTLDRIIRDLTVPEGLGGQRSASLSLPIQYDPPELQLSDCLTTETADGHLYGQRLSLTGDAAVFDPYVKGEYGDCSRGDYNHEDYDEDNEGQGQFGAPKRVEAKRVETKRVEAKRVETKRVETKRVATKRVDECMNDPQTEQHESDALNFTAEPLNFTADFFPSSGSSSSPTSTGSKAPGVLPVPVLPFSPTEQNLKRTPAYPLITANGVQLIAPLGTHRRGSELGHLIPALTPELLGPGFGLRNTYSQLGSQPMTAQLMTTQPIAPKTMAARPSATRGAQGMGTQGMGTQGMGTQGMGIQGMGIQGMGIQGMGIQGMGTQGMGTQGMGTQGMGTQVMGAQPVAAVGAQALAGLPSALNMMVMTGPLGNEDRSTARQVWEDDHVRMVFVSWIPRQLRATQGEKRKAEVSLKRLLRTELGVSGMSKVLLFPPKGTHCKLLFDSCNYMREVKEEKPGRRSGDEEVLIGAAESSLTAGADAEEWEDIEDPVVAATKKRLGQWHTTYRDVNSLFRRRREPRGGRLVKAPSLPDDYRSFVRGDMYVGDFINFQGIPLATNDTDRFQGLTLEADDRVLYFQVDDADPGLSNKAIFETWLAQLGSQKALPETLYFPTPAGTPADSTTSTIKQEDDDAAPQVADPGATRDSKNSRKNRRTVDEDRTDSLSSYSCDYFKPLGDEWSFTNNGRLCEHIGGDKFLGRVWVSYHDDPNYRYKMPRVRAKVEGRGNGVKTNIMNMGEIARALKRAPEYPTKFCGCELGASSKFEMAEGKAIVNGIHSEADVQTVIDKFIERFVLCPKCKLPEVDLLVLKGRVQGKCNACGHSGDMDNGHKVATFIVKNPPSGGDSTMGKKGKKEERRKTKTADGAADVEDEAKKVKKDKKEKSKSEKKKHKHHHRHHHRAQQTLSYSADEVQDIVKRLQYFLSKGERPLPKDFFQEVRLLQVAQDFSGALRVYITLAALFPSSAEKPKDLTADGTIAEDAKTAAEDIIAPLPLNPETLKQQANYLRAICDRSIDGDITLEALEQFVARKQPQAWEQFGLILHTLYNCDILEEDVVVGRYSVRVDPEEITKPEAKRAEAAEQVETKPIEVKQDAVVDGTAEEASGAGEGTARSSGESAESVDGATKSDDKTTDTKQKSKRRSSATDSKAADEEKKLERRQVLEARERARVAAAAFVQWLKEAESASDDEDDDRAADAKRVSDDDDDDDDDDSDSEEEIDEAAQK
ncbi:putative eukaryotic translation initiation factor 5 [Gregarina niphandrodes]|uniref:Eukaryotic translation initiation factor 5 n=1 Tax=Gregarina niphandrodes TaxID=110365 RepID=A0A023B8I6_GRENI|nr:putative eukaryotic translation initiation factor 5 [Gregarina niphandrodes]EZG69115.1 putative eukaryotic translation initiation factor 5 [Gregarina niphandrodes]|eukprot:XP_011134495.1 putative eukaryotic translation initiation factor 5 [Gregarina niphandrodes]